ncbi:MAG: RpiB/LacA/LacB family sugar-phosphate isomerase, partial [Abditibacteriota bacterium]|nr:RpiB/LacA/LacB family sugar-phosphate isomerase [Abditibacteriota bacterium]
MTDKKLKIAIGADHGGFRLKEKLAEALVSGGYDVKDFGTFTADSVDYPVIAKAVCEPVSKGDA